MLNNEQYTDGGASDNLSIVGGKWTMRVEEGTVGAEPRKLTKGKHEGATVWEVSYLNVIGYLESGRLVENEHIGMQAEILLKDGAESYLISLPASVKDMSIYLKTIIEALPNIDAHETVVFCLEDTGKKTRTGTPKYRLKVRQNNKVVPSYYVDIKDNGAGGYNIIPKNGMPEASLLRDGSKDYSEQNDFLLMKFEEYFADFSGRQSGDSGDMYKENPPDEPVEEEPADDDPIPF